MDENNLNGIIARNIIRNLDRTNTTQEELAESIGVTQAAVSNWCRGVKMPRMDKIDDICKFFSISRAQLMSEELADKGDAPFELNDEEKLFIKCYRQLPDSRKVDIADMMQLYLKQSSK